MTIAIVGSGAIGHAIATQFARKQLAVSLSNTRGPASLQDVVRELGTSVTASSLAEAVRADIVILAVPFRAIPEVAASGVHWSGRLVVDASNAIDFPAFTPTDLGGRPSTSVVAEWLPGARVVKAFNTLPAALLARDPALGGGKRVLFVAGDDSAANREVSALIESLGFAALDLGKLAEGGRLSQFQGPLPTHDLIKMPSS
jgi:8-hydroxy-5-deazaflavin:NADPH oxidoreductase